MNDELDDDTPWADPEIRAAYESALGKFILAYNQIDFYLGKILRLVISDTNQDTAKEIDQMKFTDKVLTLKFLSHTSEGKNLVRLPFSPLESLNKVRNKYAHGHMDQNPFDGSFLIRGRRVVEGASTNYLVTQAQVADDLWNELRLVEATYWFEEISD